MSDLAEPYWIAVLAGPLYNNQEFYPMILRNDSKGKTIIIAAIKRQFLWDLWLHLHQTCGSTKGYSITRLAYRDEENILRDAQASCDNAYDLEFKFCLTIGDVRDLIDRGAIAWSEKSIYLDVDPQLNPSLAHISSHS